jgi:hypothetical protein
MQSHCPLSMSSPSTPSHNSLRQHSCFLQLFALLFLSICRYIQQRRVGSNKPPKPTVRTLLRRLRKLLQPRMRRDQGTKRKKMSIFACLAKGHRHGTIDPTRRREWSLCRHRAHDEDRRYLSKCNRCFQPRLAWRCRAPMGGVQDEE